MKQFVAVLVAAFTVTSAALSVEPRSGQIPRMVGHSESLRYNRVYRAMLAAEAIDRRTLQDVFTMLCRPRPEFAKFICHQVDLRDRREWQTGVREDDFIGLERPLHERLIEVIICPALPILRETGLLDECISRLARDRWQRFWMNDNGARGRISLPRQPQ
jgi:hypothetical protein